MFVIKSLLQNDYYRASSTSQGQNAFWAAFEKTTNSCFVNNYFNVGLKPWQTNMGIKSVFNEYEVVKYVSIFLKSWRLMFTSDETGLTVIFIIMYHHDSMKTIAKAFLGNWECSVQKTVYHILPRLKLRRIFPGAYFLITNLPEEKIQVLLSEKELRELPEGSWNFFKKRNIGHYMERSNTKFCNSKNNFLSNFRCPEFLAY